MIRKDIGNIALPVVDLKATGKRIKTLRKKAGISVRQLQKIMGFTNPQAIYKWQNGKCLPSIDNLVALASILGVTIDELLIYGDDDAGSIADRLFALFRYSLCSIPIFTTRTCLEIL